MKTGNATAETTRVTGTRYAGELAKRRDAAHLEQLANFGLAIGWSLFLAGGFFWFCVVSSVDWLWLTLMICGLAHLALAVIVPELLETPCRWWMTLARWQGWLVMTIMLTVVYFALITPIGWLIRTRKGTHPFHSWENEPPDPTTAPGWEPLAAEVHVVRTHAGTHRRSLLWLLFGSLRFFTDRGHYLLLPILIALLTLGLLLFFVQGSVLAPFIYTIF